MAVGLSIHPVMFEILLEEKQRKKSQSKALVSEKKMIFKNLFLIHNFLNKLFKIFMFKS